MSKKSAFLLMILISTLSVGASRSKQPRYIFTLPTGYIGWIQVVFNDPTAARLLLKDGGYVIDVPESGIPRTADLRVHDFKRMDEFYYRVVLPNGTTGLQALPMQYVLPGDSHGGFGVMDAGEKGRGYSWFIFIGPPETRATVPHADWSQDVESWKKLHGNARVPVPHPYPKPGRIETGTTLPD